MFLWIQAIWFVHLVVAASSSGDNKNNVQRSFRILSRKFPDIMSEFAFHPTNPNVLATISGATSKVFLFTKDALLEEAGTEDEDKVMTASFTDTVGNMPTSMVFKTTSTGQTFLIVGCGHDDHLYIFLLDNETDGAMQLHQSLAISGGSVSFMTASHNSKDPFVYYNFVPDDGPGTCFLVVTSGSLLALMSSQHEEISHPRDCFFSLNNRIPPSLSWCHSLR